MKLNSILSSLALGALLTTGSLFANTVTIYNTANDGNMNGGEFRAVTSNNGDFLTFCLEKNIGVAFKTPYTYTISDRALAGGPDTHENPNFAGDPLSKGSVYLYTKFFLGTLVAPSGSGSYFDANRDYNAGMLQAAFWILEDEKVTATDVANFPQFYVNNAYVALVNSIFGVSAYDDAGPQKHVMVMNVWGENRKDIQSQLIYVPDSGMTALLLGLGLLSLAAFRRKR